MTSANFLLKILHRTTILHRLNLVAKRKVQSKTYKIPVQKGVGYLHFGTVELWMMPLLKKLATYLEGDRSFVDVGVNVGQTLLVVNSLFNDKQYIGFEPNPSCVAYVNELIRTNDLRNATIFPVGLSDKTTIKELIFFKPESADDTASVVEQFRIESVENRLKVALFRGEDLDVWTTTTPGIIKIDVEGGELEVVRGLITIIEKSRPAVICEILPVYTEENHFRIDRQLQLLQFFKEMNYKMYRVHPDSNHQLLTNIETHKNLDFSNYVFVPSEKDF